MVLRIAVVLIVVAFAALSSSPVAAQQFPEPDPFDELPFDDGFGEAEDLASTQLGVKVVLTDARGRDAIELYDVGASRDSHEYDLARSVGDVFDLERSETNVTLNGYDFLDDLQPYDIRIEIDGRLVERSGDEWVLVVPAERLLRSIENYGYDSIALTVCAAEVPVVYASTRVADDIDNDRCRYWEVTTGSDNAITITERPRESTYWTVVGLLAAAVGLLSILSWSLAGSLRRRSALRELTTSTITVSLAVLSAGVGCAAIAMIAFAMMDRPFTDLVLAHDLGVGGSFAVVAMPAILTGLPFVVTALRLLGVPPPSAVAALGVHSASGSMAAGPGIPTWLADTSGFAPPHHVPFSSRDAAGASGLEESVLGPTSGASDRGFDRAYAEEPGRSNVEPTAEGDTDGSARESTRRDQRDDDPLRWSPPK